MVGIPIALTRSHFCGMGAWSLGCAPACRVAYVFVILPRSRFCCFRLKTLTWNCVPRWPQLGGGKHVHATLAAEIWSMVGASLDCNLATNCLFRALCQCLVSPCGLKGVSMFSVRDTLEIFRALLFSRGAHRHTDKHANKHIHTQRARHTRAHTNTTHTHTAHRHEH